MSLKDTLDFLKEYGTFILTNWYTFGILALICVSITSFVFKKSTKKKTDVLEESIEMKTEKINDLEAQVESLKTQLKEQHECYEKLNGEAWVVAPKVTVSSPVAKRTSEAMQSQFLDQQQPPTSD